MRKRLTAGEVLARAAHYMDRRGWARYDYGSRRGVCVLGAVAAGLGQNPERFMAENLLDRQRQLYEAAQVALVDHIGLHNEQDGELAAAQLVADWNDEVCRDKAQAVAALRGAAELAGAGR